jgi:hypothetical protein
MLCRLPLLVVGAVEVLRVLLEVGEVVEVGRVGRSQQNA